MNFLCVRILGRRSVTMDPIWCSDLLRQNVCREHVEEIRRKRFNIGEDQQQSQLASMLQGAIEQLSAELYQKDIRFVPELIQAITLVPVAFSVATMPCELSLHLSFDFSQFACSAWIERRRRPILEIQYEIWFIYSVCELRWKQSKWPPFDCLSVYAAECGRQQLWPWSYAIAGVRLDGSGRRGCRRVHNSGCLQQWDRVSGETHVVALRGDNVHQERTKEQRLLRGKR